MTQFDRIFEELMALEGAGWIYDQVDLQQLGISKRDFVSPPKSVPLAKGNPPAVVKCPFCGNKFDVAELQLNK